MQSTISKITYYVKWKNPYKINSENVYSYCRKCILLKIEGGNLINEKKWKEKINSDLSVVIILNNDIFQSHPTMIINNNIKQLYLTMTSNNNIKQWYLILIINKDIKQLYLIMTSDNDIK
jgi:hypothetical protein